MISARKTVLIVESDGATHWLYQRALQQDYQVLVAATEEQAPPLLKAHTVHGIVLEPGPVGGPGWVLLAELKRHPETRSIPVVLCTAQDERRRGLAMGADAYLVKPVLPADLLAAIRRLVGGITAKGG